MDLKTYMTSARGVRKTLAEKVGCHANHLTDIASGGARCGPKLAQRIEEATNGIVNRSELRPDIWPPRVRRESAEAA